MDRAPLNEAHLRESVLASAVPTVSAGGLRFHWRRLDVVAETGSTNADLAARAVTENIDGHILLAEAQTAGRGRLDRSWTTPERAQIAMSIGVGVTGDAVLSPAWLPLLTGIAVVDAVNELTGVGARLKWPNDVLIGDLKVAGILAELVHGGVQNAVILGLGLNVHLTDAELPVPHATSLDLAGATVSRDDVAIAVLRALGDIVRQWQSGELHAAAAVERYRERLATVGREITVTLPGRQSLDGTAVGVDSDGRLIVDCDGELTAVAAGDVQHVRLADR